MSETGEAMARKHLLAGVLPRETNTHFPRTYQTFSCVATKIFCYCHLHVGILSYYCLDLTFLLERHGTIHTLYKIPVPFT
jgi:hypothetical protein